MKYCIDKQCKRAGEPLSAEEFYFKTSASDGLDPYCSECRLRRVNECRANRNAYLTRQRIVIERKPVISRSGFAFSLVYDAILKGCDTREKIRRETKLNYDEIGEALCELLWIAKAVRIQERKYLPIDAEIERDKKVA